MFFTVSLSLIKLFWESNDYNDGEKKLTVDQIDELKKEMENLLLISKDRLDTITFLTTFKKLGQEEFDKWLFEHKEW